MRALLSILLLLTPLPAGAFTARNGMEVAKSGATDIAVLWENGRRDTDYWCAAGDYAQRVLNQSGDTRLWRASDKPRRAGQGILFTLDPTRQAPGAGLSQFGAGPRDGAITVAAAIGGHCRIRLPFPLD